MKHGMYISLDMLNDNYKEILQLFIEAKEDFIEFDIDGMKQPFISLEKLIRNKEVSGRSKDMEDLKKLKKHL